LIVDFNLPLTSIKDDERTEVIYGSSNVLDPNLYSPHPDEAAGILPPK
jgi:hypothetical protein